MLHLNIQEGELVKHEDRSDTTTSASHDILLHVDASGPHIIGRFKGRKWQMSWSEDGNAKYRDSDTKQDMLELKWHAISGRQVLSVVRLSVTREVRESGSNKVDCDKHWAAYAFNSTTGKLERITGAAEVALTKHTPLGAFRKLTGGRSGSCGEGQ